MIAPWIAQQCKIFAWLPLAGEKQIEPLPATPLIGSHERFNVLNYIKENLRYEDGNLYRLQNRGGRLAGSVAGWVTTCNGRLYKKININRKTMYVHQIIFLMHYGYMPDCIDHVDGDSLNNRIENLREATQSQNMGNSRMKNTNTSGYKGVTFRKDTKKWSAGIMVNGKHISLGSYLSKEDAANAYANGAKKFFGSFAKATNRAEGKATL